MMKWSGGIWVGIGVFGLLLQLPLAAGSVFEEQMADSVAWGGDENALVANETLDGRPVLKFTLPGRRHCQFNGNAVGKNALKLEIQRLDTDFWLTIRLGSRPYYDCFSAMVPIAGEGWQTVIVPFEQFLPGFDVVYSSPSPLAPEAVIRGKIGGAILPLEELNTVTFGSYWQISHRNEPIAPYSFLVRNIELAAIGEGERPAGAVEPERSRTLDEVVKKMAAGEAVTIDCIGDSITAGTSVEQPERNAYPSLLQAQLRQAFDNEQIVVRNLGVGGAFSFELRLWAQRDLTEFPADLVTVMVGFNDRIYNVDREIYRQAMLDYVDRVRHSAAVAPALVLLTPSPGLGDRYHTQDELAEAIRTIGVEKQLPVVDVSAAFQALPMEEFESLMADFAHPNKRGQALIADRLAALFRQAR
ncbi:SGNH/GDSL hydrolase family protein [Victivallis sp. Marseille-Q1083]|uniref:SGNH/GDSL hydrolase family protein n=1 Tax=Victivallis sp. Marseille-Q1083 TaxID=2717288 RepID=UPI001589879A|nr:SGNH/GDSL hydrolase family protein [Victivallis sp. Marseille-Q1083]